MNEDLKFDDMFESHTNGDGEATANDAIHSNSNSDDIEKGAPANQSQASNDENDNRIVIASSSVSAASSVNDMAVAHLAEELKDNVDNLLKPPEVHRRAVNNPIPISSSSSNNKSSSSTVPIRLNDFNALSLIGTGAYGKVFLVNHRRKNKVYAMKVLDKVSLIEKKNVNYIHDERNILTKLDHPFVISLKYAFQTRDNLYLVMEYVGGGELFERIKKEGIVDEPTARFYIAEMVLALNYIHKNKIIHRDIKPENILLDKDGHIRLTDFGLARVSMNNEEARGTTVCGTDIYMAPEMIAESGCYSYHVDWWSVGILMFELISGDVPFKDSNKKRLYSKIMNTTPKYPRYLTNECISLMNGFICRDVEKRLGCTKATTFNSGGITAIKTHPFFKKFPWEKIEDLSMPAPLKVVLKDELDTSNFLVFEEEKKGLIEGGKLVNEQATYLASPKGSLYGGDSTFGDFSWIHPSCMPSPRASLADDNILSTSSKEATQTPPAAESKATNETPSKEPYASIHRSPSLKEMILNSPTDPLLSIAPLSESTLNSIKTEASSKPMEQQEQIPNVSPMANNKPLQTILAVISSPPEIAVAPVVEMTSIAQTPSTVESTINASTTTTPTKAAKQLNPNAKVWVPSYMR